MDWKHNSFVSSCVKVLFNTEDPWGEGAIPVTDPRSLGGGGGEGTAGPGSTPVNAPFYRLKSLKLINL